MLKVLIADDEPKVCKLINCLIDWNSIGLEVVGIVHNGSDALKFLETKDADIIITDIRMPGVNGLELIRRAKEINEKINFIIISGYNNFEYAQKAIKYGVEDYILKPVKEKELLLCLKKIIEKRKAYLASQKEKEKMQNRIHSDTEKARNVFFMEIIRNKGAEPLTDTLACINENYYCNFGDPLYRIIMIQPIFYEKIEDEQLLSFFTAKISSLIQSTFSEFRETIIINQGEIVYCLFNGTKDDMDFLQSELKRLRTSIQNLQDVFTKLKIYIFLSLCHTDIHDLPLCMEEVIHASYDKLITFSSIIEYKQLSSPLNDHKIINGQFRKDFLAGIETLNIEKITQLIESLTAALHSSALSGKAIRDTFMELLDLYGFGIRSHNHAIPYEEMVLHLKWNFTYHININELMSELLNEIKKSFQEYIAEKSQEITKPIRLAKEYIKQHYNEPLTLEILGNEVGLNPAYFSSVFKKETGSSFVDYLNEVRVENAKQLLLDGNYSVTDVCDEVGFNDIKYFTKRFKKSTGLSPTEYCKLYS